MEVEGDIFQGPDSPAVTELNLTNSEMRETSTVLADDPFRAIQTLPGVSAEGGNDFFAQLSVMGAPYSNTSIYLDDILVPAPFHGTDITQGATLSMFTSETIEDIKLLPAAYPEKYGDAVGAAIDLRTRDGSRTAPTFRTSIGLADSELLGEGELGAEKKGSWLASARKSYLGYLLRSRLKDTSDDVSFYDGDLKLTYDVAPNQAVSFYGVGGHTFYELLKAPYTLSPDDIQRATNDFAMGRLGWRWTVTPHLLIDTRAAYLEAPFHYWNESGQLLNKTNDAEWVTGGSVVWNWQKDHVLEAGWMTRRVSASNESTVFDSDGSIEGTIGEGGTGWKNDVYVQQASSLFDNRLHLVGGLRADTAQQYDIHPLSPQLSAALQVARATQLQFGVGRYNQFQFPPYYLPQVGGCPNFLAFNQAANHYTGGIEQRLGESTRIKILFFDRQNGTTDDSSVFYKNGCSTMHGQIERDYARGAQIVLQSRTANRLSGWIGYTVLTARESQFESTNLGSLWIPYIPTTEDQRNTLNVFASYRITPTVHVSGKLLFGSGFPIPSVSNATRLGDYQRLDVRAEKDWAFTRWKIALYGEVLNVTNHYNPRYFYTSYANNPSGATTSTVVTGQGLPITPTMSLAFEF